MCMWRTWSILMIENLLPGFFSCGDNAYVNTEHMPVPFPGQNLDQCRDSYNVFEPAQNPD
jgi:hypothetical protein